MGATFAVADGGNNAGDATCNAGEIAIGGGAFTFTANLCTISSSFAPADTSDTWRIAVRCAAGGGAAVSPQVVCLAT